MPIVMKYTYKAAIGRTNNSFKLFSRKVIANFYSPIDGCIGSHVIVFWKSKIYTDFSLIRPSSPISEFVQQPMIDAFSK